MSIFKIIAEIGLNKTAFDAGLKSATKQVESFGKGLKSQLAGAFSAAAAVQFAKSIVDMGSQIQDMSQRLGIGAEEVQRFALAAKLGGQDIDVIAGAVERLRRAMNEGDNPLSIFGVSSEMMRSEDVTGVLEQMGKNLEDFGLNAERTAVLFDVFGKSAGKLVPVLKELKGASKGTLFFSKNDVQDIDAADDFLTKLWNTVKVLAYKGQKTGALAPFMLAGRLANRGKSNDPIIAPPGMSEADKESAEALKKSQEHQAAMDRALEIEKMEREQEAEEHRRQQDIVLANEKADQLADFEKRMRGSHFSGGGGSIPGVFVGGTAAGNVPAQLSAIQRELIQLRQLQAGRGIVVRDIVR